MAMPTRTARPNRPPQPQVQPRPAVAGQPSPTPTAQGRSIVNQGGQPGVVGRGGNFQALGNAALRRAGQGGAGGPAGAGGAPRTVPWQPTPDMPITTKPMPWEPQGPMPSFEEMSPFMQQLRGGAGGNIAGVPGQAEGAGIGSAIQSLKSQLGMLPPGHPMSHQGTDALRPGSVWDGPQSITGGGLMAGQTNPRNMTKPMLTGGPSYFGGDETGGGATQNPYAMLLKQRLAGAGGAAGAGMLPTAMANYAR